jgi:tape measure domain-containing protein
MAIASYFAKVSIGTDLAALKKVDRYLQTVERKMQAFQKKMMATNGAFNINFKFNTTRLQFEAQRAFNDVARRTTFPVNNFRVDRQALSSQVNSAVRNAVANASRTITLNARVNQPRVSQAQGRGVSTPAALGAGAAGGAFGRYGMLGAYGGPAILGGAALYGGGVLNRKGQELEANDLALIAAAGSEAQGANYSKFLSDLGDRLGKRTATMSPFFAQMLAGSKGTALEPHLETGFTSLMEYSSVMGLDDQKVKGTIRAFTQMIGKQQIMAEELRGQAAEHLPPVVRLMADVAAGGDVKKLNKMMEQGQLDPNIHLPLLFDRLKEEAAPFMERYFKGSRFAQGKMDKAAEDQMRLFSKAGGEEGFSRIFRTVTDLLKESDRLTASMANGFNNITSHVRELVLFPQSFIRALEGKDSLVGDWLGADTTTQLIKDWEQIKNLFNDIMGIQTPSWLPTLEATAKEIAAIMNAVAEFQRWRTGQLPTEMQSNTSTPWDTTKTALNNFGVNAAAAQARGEAVYGDPTSPYYKDPAGYDAQQKDMQMAAAQDQAAGRVENKYNFGDITISVPLTAGMTPEEQGLMIADSFKASLEDALQNYPQTE